MLSTAHHQTHAVGRGVFYTFLLIFIGAKAELYNTPVFEDMSKFFDSNGCITGRIIMVPTSPVAMQDSQVTSSSVGESAENSENGSQILESESHATLSHMSEVGKEKTPMCLVNELARFNKIEHQYRLTNEEGPPHKKKFTVTLKFGTEEYTADGASIKKAQHAAASIALKNTKYRHPQPKSSRSQRGTKGNITPTVELNALAMKRGEPTIYTLVESPQYSTGQYNGFVGYPQRGMYTQATFHDYHAYGYTRGGKQLYRGYTPRMDPRYFGGKPPLYKVSVRVGDREFNGEGTSAQAARHDAASKALQVLNNLPVEETCPARNITCDGIVDPDSTTELKSPISLVHEIALKRNLNVHFEVISEKGQPHMRTFVTRCTVGDKFETIGEGNGKKVSKKRAAEKMLEKLKTLPPTTTVTASGLVGSLSRMKRKPNATKKKSRNLIKDTNASGSSTQPPEQKYEPESPEDMNPISRLIQIQQAKREKEPVYTVREERGLPRRREFVMEVTMGEHSSIGSGPNKKIAKRNAAEGLLQQLGYSSPTVNRTGHPIQQQHSKQVRFSDEKPQASAKGGTVGRQIVPGLLLMNENKSPNQHSPKLKATAAVAKEYLTNGNSPTADVLAGKKTNGNSAVLAPTDQLLYLAQVLNFEIQFSDFPKGNHGNFLSLVSVTTDPPQVCHGSGPTIELSHEEAALRALRYLSEMGFDSITPAKKDQTTVQQSNQSQQQAVVTTQSSNETSGPQPENLYLNLANAHPKEDNFVNGK